MPKPRLLDLFCGAGGAAMGYHRAGFDVYGIDSTPQPHYPFTFWQHDALELDDEWLGQFDVIHASPPCQAYASLAAKDGRHPRLIEPVRAKLCNTSVTVIENIEGAPIRRDVRLCGSMFALYVRRHRCFEVNGVLVEQPVCNHSGHEIRAYYGKPGWLAWDLKGAQVQKAGRKPLLRGSVEQAPVDMGIDWMTWDELREAIPPAYTEYLGRQLLDAL